MIMTEKAFFTDKIIVEDINYNEDTMRITIKSKNKGHYCPKCSCYSINPHSKYIKKFLDMPMVDKQTILLVIVRRFYCKNINCFQIAFSEQFDELFQKYHRRTNRLSNFIVNLALSQNENQLSRILGKLISISSSSLLRIAKGYNRESDYEANVIGIDDFSFRKGIKFGTLICDLKTNKPIDLIIVGHRKKYLNI